jgi:hypothetical protein
MLDKTTNQKSQPSNRPSLSKPSPAYPLHQEVTHSDPSDKQLNSSAFPIDPGTKPEFSESPASHTECRVGGDGLLFELITFRKKYWLLPTC